MSGTLHGAWWGRSVPSMEFYVGLNSKGESPYLYKVYEKGVKLMKASTTQIRPSLDDALAEVWESLDSHWTATLSKIGMTRIKRSVVQNAYMDDFYYG